MHFDEIVSMLKGERKPDGSYTAGMYIMGEEEYRAAPGLNWSTIKNTLVSPEYAKYKERNPTKATAAMELGTLIHSAVLCPGTLDKEYFVPPEVTQAGLVWEKGSRGWCAEFEGKTLGPYKTKKEAVEDFPNYSVGNLRFAKLAEAKAYIQTLAGERKVVSSLDHNNAVRIRDRLYNKDCVAMDLFNKEGLINEAVFMWDDYVMLSCGETVSVRCKAKVDMWDVTGRTVWDLKTTRDSSAHSFVKTVLKYQYHGQLAWYADGISKAMESVGFYMSPKDFGIVAVEVNSPHQTCVMKFDEDFKRLARKCSRKALQLWVESDNSGEWSPRHKDVVVMSVPTWVKENDYEL